MSNSVVINKLFTIDFGFYSSIYFVFKGKTNVSLINSSVSELSNAKKSLFWLLRSNFPLFPKKFVQVFYNMFNLIQT